jgi:hypothetical protein
MAADPDTSAEDAKLIERSFREYWAQRIRQVETGWSRRKTVRRPLRAWKYVMMPVLMRHFPIPGSSLFGGG